MTPTMTPTAVKLHQVRQEVGSRIYERDVLIELEILCLISRLNLFILGVPGAAKTLMTSLLAQHFVGLRHFKTQFYPSKPPESVYGPLNGERLKDYEFVYDVSKGTYLPRAHLATLDEIWKAGATTVDGLLAILNHEGFPNGDHYEPCHLLCAIGLSNELPSDESSGAAYDRFPVRAVTGHIQEPRNFIALLTAPTDDYVPTTTVDFAELEQAVRDVDHVKVDRSIAETIFKARAKLRDEGVTVSDRRWRQSLSLLRAAAYMAGRAEVTQDDLEWLRFMTWETPDQIPKCEEVVFSVCSEDVAEMRAMADLIAEVRGQLASMKAEAPLAEDNSPKAEEWRRVNGRRTSDLTQKLRAAGRKAEDLHAKALANGRSVDRITAMQTQLAQTYQDAKEAYLG